MAAASKNHFMAKCGDLTVRITWNAPQNPSAVSSHNELVVYQLKNDDGAGIDLGNCELARNQQEEKSHPFHLMLKSGDDSFASGIPSKELYCFGCEPIEVDTKGRRFGIISVQASPVSTKHDLLTPLP